MAWQPPTPSSPYSALGVYIFAGGFTVGMSDHFKILGHLEDGMFGVQTFKANFPRVPVWINPDRWPRDRFRDGGVDVVYGNPPCAPWSPIGRSIRNGSQNWRTDPNVDCARRLIQYGLDVRPKVWVMESVPQIQKSEFLLDMALVWLEAGYAFTLVREDAKRFGLPQQRRRCFMVAHRVAIPWQVFEDDCVPQLETAGEALEVAPSAGWYPDIPDQHLHLLPKIGPGGSMRAAWEAENPHLIGADGRDTPVVGRPLIMIHRIDPTMPSGVIIGQSVYIHPFEDRLLGHLEASKLCGYPDDYQWVNGSRKAGNDLVAQVAKAVTPPAARFLAKNLVLGLRGGVEAEVKAEVATFWAHSQKVKDTNWVDAVWPMDLDHDCTMAAEAAG